MTPSNPYEFTREAYNELVKKIPHPIVSQRSEYEEIELVEDCTLYDMYRQPRAPVTDPKVTRTLPVRVLNADLTCPICLGIIRNTEVVMECLHRFCSDCIQRCLRLAKNECPSCRIHIPSKRSLRRDTNFDELIAKIYPDLEEFTTQEDKLIAEINRERHFNNALTESTKLGVQQQQTQRKSAAKKKVDSETSPSSASSSGSPPSSPNGHAGEKREASWSAAANGTSRDNENGRKKMRTDTTTTTSPARSTTSASGAVAKKSEDDDKVNVRVLLHPDERAGAPKLEKTLFRTSYILKVRHLKKHLKELLKLESSEGLRIVLPAANSSLSGLKTEASGPIRKDLEFDQELEDHVTMYDIYQQYGMGFNWQLQLLYHFSDTIVNGVAQFIASGIQ